MGHHNDPTWITAVPLANTSVSSGYHHLEERGINLADDAHIPKSWGEWILVIWSVMDICHHLWACLLIDVGIGRGGNYTNDITSRDLFIKKGEKRKEREGDTVII